MRLDKLKPGIFCGILIMGTVELRLFGHGHSTGWRSMTLISLLICLHGTCSDLSLGLLWWILWLDRLMLLLLLSWKVCSWKSVLLLLLLLVLLLLLW